MSLLVTAVALVTGACVMSLEILCGRMTAPLFGSGVSAWAFVISVTLLGLTSGYFLGGRQATAHAAPPARNLALAALCIFLLDILTVDRLALIPRAIHSPELGALLYSLVFIFPPILLLATFTPMAVRLLLDRVDRSARVAGRLYAVSTIGSVAGTVGTALLLIPNMATRTILSLNGLACLACAASLYLLGGPRARTRGSTAALLAACAGALASVLMQWGTAAPSPLLALHPAPETVAEIRSTEYADYFLERDGNATALSYLVGGRLFRHSVADLSDPSNLIQPYAQSIARLIAFPNRLDRILLLGSGGGVLARYFLAALPDARVTAVEIDPEADRIARERMGLEDGPNLETHIMDARVFLEQTDQTFDYIVQDTFLSDLAPFHLATMEFFALAKSRLAPGGCLAVNLLRDSEFEEALIATASRVFPTTFLFETITLNQTLLACADPGLDLADVRERAARLQARLDLPYPPGNFDYYLAPPGAPAQATAQAMTRTDQLAPAALLKQRKLAK